MRIEKSVFDKLGGTNIYSYKISNSKNEYVKILTLGGVINEIVVNDKNGIPADIVCGYDSADKYLSAEGYQGALIGRYSNRISNASFTLDNETYKLFVNSGTKDSLHGGKYGFDKKIWDCTEFENEDSAGLVMSILSPDMEEGYPGNLKVTVTYTFTEDCKLYINYKATTDKATPVNLTNHAYFNLDGFDGGSVMEHNLTINGDKYIEVDEDQIPTGDPIAVKGTDFDIFLQNGIQSDRRRSDSTERNRQRIADEGGNTGGNNWETQSRQKRRSQSRCAAEACRALDETAEKPGDDHHLDAAVGRDPRKCVVDDFHGVVSLEDIEQKYRAEYDQDNIQRLQYTEN